MLPPLPVTGLEAAFVEGMDDVYSGAVAVGRDGKFVSMPSGNDEIVVSARL